MILFFDSCVGGRRNLFGNISALKWNLEGRLDMSESVNNDGSQFSISFTQFVCILDSGPIILIGRS